jgi:hypothetical protein
VDLSSLTLIIGGCAMRWTRVTILAFLLISIAAREGQCRGDGNGSEQNYIIAIDVGELVGTHLQGLDCRRSAGGVRGIKYTFSQKQSGIFWDVQLGAYPELQRAADIFNKRKMESQVGYRSGSVSLGDEGLLDKSPTDRRGSILFRYRNLVIGIQTNATVEDLMRVASQIDSDLRQGRNGAILGSKPRQPQIALGMANNELILPRRGMKRVDIDAPEVDILAVQADTANPRTTASAWLRDKTAFLQYSSSGQDCVDTISLTLITKEHMIFQKQFPIKVTRRLEREPLTQTEKQQLAQAIATLKNPTSTTGDRVSAIDVIVKCEDKSPVPLLIEHLDKKYRYSVRNSAAKALGALGDARAVPHLIETLESANKGDETLMRVTINSLGEIGDAAALPVIEKYQNYDDEPIRLSARRAVGNIKEKARLQGKVEE